MRSSSKRSLTHRLARAAPGGAAFPLMTPRRDTGGHLCARFRLLWGVGAALALSGCGGAAASISPGSSGGAARHGSANTVAAAHARAAREHPRLLASARASQPTGFVPAVLVAGRPAVWIARSQSGIALLSFDQSLVTLVLHSGTVDAGGSGWHWGPRVGPAERQNLVAAFNGGFKLDTGAGGFMSYGRVAAPVRAGLGSIVTYADRSTDIGSWHQELPAPGRPLVSVRQNLTLLIDHGNAASILDCLHCWGATLGGITAPARSALGVTADGRLIWAGGAHVTVPDLANALLAARVVRAVELDINPEWVAGYLYEHRGASRSPLPVAVVPGQVGVPGQFLAPYSRDFFALHLR